MLCIRMWHKWNAGRDWCVVRGRRAFCSLSYSEALARWVPAVRYQSNKIKLATLHFAVWRNIVMHFAQLYWFWIGEVVYRAEMWAVEVKVPNGGSCCVLFVFVRLTSANRAWAPCFCRRTFGYGFDQNRIQRHDIMKHSSLPALSHVYYICTAHVCA